MLNNDFQLIVAALPPLRVPPPKPQASNGLMRQGSYCRRPVRRRPSLVERRPLAWASISQPRVGASTPSAPVLEPCGVGGARSGLGALDQVRAMPFPIGAFSVLCDPGSDSTEKLNWFGRGSRAHAAAAPTKNMRAADPLNWRLD